jgi:hypothetical protein
MRCHKCGTEIADKALICFRCGTATTEPMYKPALPARRGGTPVVVSGLALALLVLLALYMGRIAAGGAPRTLSWVAVVVALLVVVLRARLRRR